MTAHRTTGAGQAAAGPDLAPATGGAAPGGGSESAGAGPGPVPGGAAPRARGRPAPPAVPARAVRAGLQPLRCLLRHRSVIRRFAINEIQEKYRTTFLGLFWLVLTPALYLVSFTLVFGYIIPGRVAAWERLGDGVLAFVLAVFSGLIVFWFYSGMAVHAAGLIPKYRHLVTEIRFPTEVLAWVVTVSALFGMGIHLAFFVVLYIYQFGTVPWLLVALPVILLPATLFMTGVTWVVAAVGAVVRDVGQVVQVAMTALLLVSGVFYPAEQVPERVRGIFLLNPVARTIEDFRVLVFDHTLPDPAAYAVFLLAGLGTLVVGYRVYKRVQPRLAEYL